MKRGLSYVDWTISVGLFIIYIISIFVILGPAFKQDYSSEYLGNIIKNGLEENTSLNLKRFPFYIRLTDPTEQIPSGEYILDIINLPSEITEITDNDQFGVSNGTVFKFNKEYTGNPPTIRAVLDLQDFGMNYPGDIGQGLIFLSEKEIFSTYAITVEDPFERELKTTFGVAEDISGIYEDYFNDLFYNQYNPLTYEEIKEVLRYPKEKDFTIEIFQGVDFNNEGLIFYIKKEPTDKDEVNVFMWADWYIHEDSKRDPITVLIKTW